MEYKFNGLENFFVFYFREDLGNLYYWKEIGYNFVLIKSYCKII